MPWEHGVAGSSPAAETIFLSMRVLGRGCSSMAEPWTVNPLMSVRLRPVTPKRMRRQASLVNSHDNRSHFLTRPSAKKVRFLRWASINHHPLVAELADATVSEAVATRHVRSTRTEGTKSGSSEERFLCFPPSHTGGCSSRVEHPAFNRQVWVRSPAPAPDPRQVGRSSTVEQRTLTPLVGGSSPPALAIHAP